MHALPHLPLAILAVAVAVFVASSLIHMVFKWHNADYLPLKNEDAVRDALRSATDGPGQYVLPYCGDMKAMQDPAVQQKFVEGPVGFVVLRPSGAPKMGGFLFKWFLLNLFVATIAAHAAAGAAMVQPGRHMVFHAAAIVTFVAYATGSLSDGIWKGQPRKAVAKDLLDALIYAVVSGLVLGAFVPA